MPVSKMRNCGLEHNSVSDSFFIPIQISDKLLNCVEELKSRFFIFRDQNRNRSSLEPLFLQPLLHNAIVLNGHFPWT